MKLKYNFEVSIDYDKHNEAIGEIAHGDSTFGVDDMVIKWSNFEEDMLEYSLSYAELEFIFYLNDDEDAIKYVFKNGEIEEYEGLVVYEDSTITFKTNSKLEAAQYLKASDMANLLFELKINMWRRWKHSNKDITLDELKEAISELFEEYNINLNDIV